MDKFQSCKLSVLPLVGGYCLSHTSHHAVLAAIQWWTACFVLFSKPNVHAWYFSPQNVWIDISHNVFRKPMREALLKRPLYWWKKVKATHQKPVTSSSACPTSHGRFGVAPQYSPGQAGNRRGSFHNMIAQQTSFHIYQQISKDLKAEQR